MIGAARPRAPPTQSSDARVDVMHACFNDIVHCGTSTASLTPRSPQDVAHLRGGQALCIMAESAQHAPTLQAAGHMHAFIIIMGTTHGSLLMQILMDNVIV